MNPTKRKKLYRAELAKQKQEVMQPVIVAETKKESLQVVQETASLADSALEMGLKVLDSTETSESSKKDKKKKSFTQDV